MADRCPVTLYLENDLSTEISRQGMRSNLRRATKVLSSDQLEDPRLLPWHLLEQRHVARLRALLTEQGSAPTTINTTLAGVKGVLRQCWRLGLMSHEQFAAATDVKPARGSRVSSGRCLNDGEIRALMAACCDDGSPAGARDAALLALALGAGLRRAELVGLGVQDYSRNEGQEHGELIVAGKGNKERKVYLSNGSRDAIEDWIAVRGSEPGPLFVAISKSGQFEPSKGLTGQALAKTMAKRAGQAGVANFGPHDLRRTMISSLLDRGVDISTAARVAGHASIETTRVYDLRGERSAIAASEVLHVPYSRRHR